MKEQVMSELQSLKAKAYDCVVVIEAKQNELRQLNNEIKNRLIAEREKKK